MFSQQRSILLSASILITLGIILGAFAAHGLEGKISSEKIASFEVGVRYQMYHGLALLALVGIFPLLNFSLKWIFRLMIIGLFFFSGSIYLLALQSLLGINISSFIGPITPIGGLLLILAWSLFIIRLIKQKSN